jgi:hypothetical protein
MKILLTLGISTLVSCASLNAATVAHYEFNGTGQAEVGSTVADLTGNHPGTVAGAPLTYGTDAMMGGYLSFKADGTNVTGLGDRVEIPGAWDLSFSTEQTYTIEVVFRTTQTGTNGVLVSKGADVSNPDTQWWIRHQGNGLVRGLIEGSNGTEDNATSAGTTVSDGQWHHVALVFNGTVSPKTLEIFVDGVFSGRDTSVGTTGLIGGADTDAVIIGEFATLVGNRSFAGDIAALRFSDTALTPTEFLADGFTRIVEITPADGSSFLPASTAASFKVKSPNTGVAASGIQVILNGTDISSQLVLAGTDADRTVTLPSLAANQFYQLQVNITDKASRVVTSTVRFNTLTDGIVFIEGEDYNFDNGKFITNPQLSTIPGTDNYLDRLGVEGVDYHQTNTPAFAQYRIGDQPGTAVTLDSYRTAYTQAGVDDYMTRDHSNSEWLNYTRTFAADTYQVYVRLAKGNTTPFVIALDQVTAGSTTSSQTLSPIGTFQGTAIGTAAGYDFYPLKDLFGNELAVSLNGTTTLRLTFVSGGNGVLLNYLVLVPYSGVQRPFLASALPAPGTSAYGTVPLQMLIRNADTQVDTAKVQLRLDGTAVTPSVSATALGASVSYTPSLLSTGLHSVTLIAGDTSGGWVTNQWQFLAGNPAVHGYWGFDEQAPGNPVSTNTGAILDRSGNVRNGTGSAAGMLYVAGSSKYGNTSALRLTTGSDRVVVPDLGGDFNFTNSFTFEAVIRSTATSTAGAILAKNGTGDGEGEYWWRAPGNASGAQRMGANGVFLTAAAKLNDGEWHHVAMVYDQAAGQIRLYADYVEEGSAALATDRPIGRPGDLQIGGFINSTTSEFEGDIDFIRISAGALAPAEFIQASEQAQPVQLIGIGRTTTAISFGFEALAGRSYVVESAPSLGATWTDVETISGHGAVTNLTYPAAELQKLFRVRSE